MENEDFTLEDRILCSDGACIGLVGPDGRCKVCGKEYLGDEPLPPVEPRDQPAETSEPLRSPDQGDRGADGHDSTDATDPDERVCCPDDMCVGIIGPDGRCGTCGRSA
jgi:hypothetical protein